MKKGILIITVLVLVSSVALARHGKRGVGLRQALKYNVAAETTYSATVVGQDTAFPARFRIQLKDGHQLSLVVAPVWYMTRQDFSLAAGQSISVVGVMATLRDGSEGVLARQVTTNKATYQFRNTTGVPMWSGRTGTNGMSARNFACRAQTGICPGNAAAPIVK